MIDDLTMDSKTLLCQGVVAASQKNKIDEAVEMLNEAAFRDKLDHRPYYLAGRILAAAGRYDEALTYFGRASKRYNLIKVPALRLGRQVLKEKGSDEAVRFLEKANNRNLCSYECQGFLAGLYHKESMDKDARDLYDAMIKENPDEPAAYMGLAQISNAEKDYKKEADLLEQAASSGGFNKLSDAQKGAIYHSGAFALYNLGEYQNAKDKISKALQFGDFPEWWLLSGWIYAKLDDPAMAGIKFNKAIDKDDKLAPAYIGRGDTSLKLGQSKAAVDAYKRAVYLDPLDAVYKLKLALALAQDSQIEDAKNLLSDAIKMGGQHLPADLLKDVSNAISAAPEDSVR